jgi:antitoxin component of MazEF toxin-antitoxin module
MAEFDATVRRVGDSMGILIPAGVVKELNAKPGTRIHVVIPRKVDWSGIRGRFRSKASTEELIRLARTERD